MIFNTLKTKLSSTNKPHVYGSATLRTATASTEFTGDAHIGVGFKKWGFITSFTYSDKFRFFNGRLWSAIWQSSKNRSRKR